MSIERDDDKTETVPHEPSSGMHKRVVWRCSLCDEQAESDSRAVLPDGWYASRTLPGTTDFCPRCRP